MTVVTTEPSQGGFARVRWLAPAVVLGLLTGAATSLLQAILPVPWAALVNAASPWLAVAFVVGALAPRRELAAVAGVVTCMGEVIGYYVAAAARGFPASLSVIVVWIVFGTIAGSVIAVLGQTWRRGGWFLRFASSAALAGCFLLEGIRYETVLHYTSRAELFSAIALLVLAVGVAVPRLSPARSARLPI